MNYWMMIFLKDVWRVLKGTDLQGFLMNKINKDGLREYS